MKQEHIDICFKKINGEIAISWDELASNFGFRDGENLRQRFKKYRAANGMLPSRTEHINTEVSNKLSELDIQLVELKKERVKVQIEKKGLNNIIRSSGLIDLICEKLQDSIDNLDLIVPPKRPMIADSKATGIVGLADVHYGKQFKIYGLQGEIINEFSMEICEQRMWDLLNRIIDKIRLHKLSKIYLYLAGDIIDGLHHVNQLMTAETDTVDSVMRFAEFLAQWINSLTEHVDIELYSVLGNHPEIRPLNTKAGQLPTENLEKIITWYVKSRLEGNRNVKVHEINTVASFDLYGKNIVMVHGQNEHRLDDSIKDYSMIYGRKVDLLLTGHLHYSMQKDVVLGSEVIQFPSLCGVDEYAMKLKKASKAGSKMIVLYQNSDDKCVHDFVLS